MLQFANKITIGCYFADRFISFTQESLSAQPINKYMKKIIGVLCAGTLLFYQALGNAARGNPDD